MDREAWWAAAHGVAWLSNFHFTSLSGSISLIILDALHMLYHVEIVLHDFFFFKCDRNTLEVIMQENARIWLRL